MKHLGTKRIETNRLILRRFTLEDTEPMFNNWGSRDAVTKFLSWPTHKTLDDTSEILTHWINNYSNDDFYNWGIILKGETPTLVGSIGLVSIDNNIFSGSIGYCISDKCWGKGITAEALEAVIKYLFHEVGFNRLEARHDVKNPNSGKVMKKCGMLYEGTLRQSGKNNLGLADMCTYGILSSDII